MFKSGYVVIAPDKFKGSLTAAEVATRVAAGLGPGVDAVVLPVADGGDGTVDAVVACGFTRVEVEVTGPVGEPVTAAYAWRDARAEGEVPTAVVELAEASGLRRLPATPSPAPGTTGPAEAAAGPAGEPGSPAHRGVALAPLTATSRGAGELIAHALRRGARRVVLGLGGSACTDGGSGMMGALGVRFLDASGQELPPGGAALRDLERIDVSGLVPLDGVEFVVAGDVDNPLLGPNGAAAVYGPQKGASPQDVRTLDAALARLAAVAAHTHGLVGAVEHDGVVRAMGVAGQPGAGAAGGVGFAALAFLSAGFRPGIDYLLDLLGFRDRLAGARLVITGEGSLDEQTLRGKAPAGVAAAAAEAGVPVVAVCGRRTLGDAELAAAGITAAYALTDIEPDPAVCMAKAGPLLERLTGKIAENHL
ncbi:glycerate kinase [Streptosporangium becharense]|uniref:Glycerate kinase n=1 Tax=Streptosporangium becharense TaxID=1816182 RepID=A0A7W9MFE0_9ACTN|nr:glycerate kinase [Streptosporangium becharense]MBB2912779.1 glycerate kinase [Streptosporangium becharense]MBB5818396.1 glycerate kinase [Streptosporangium becharense]